MLGKKKKNINKCDIKEYVVYFSLFIVAFVFLINSPMHPWNLADIEVDSSVFKTVANDMRNGLMPYRDSFDHKGPLIYFINYIGGLISNYRGTWVLEYLSMVVSLFAMYRIARLVLCNYGKALFVIIISISPLFECFKGGNFTEEYAIPFISMAIFIFLNYFINEKVSPGALIICGISFASVLCLRVNMIAVWIVFSIAVLFWEIAKKTAYRLIYMLGWFLFGSGIVLIPIFFWLILNNSFCDFWKDYILFNIFYTSGNQFNSLFAEFWETSFDFISMGGFSYIICFIILIFLIRKKRNKIDYIYLICVFVSLLLVNVSGYGYLHYGMILIPLFAYPYASLYKELIFVEEKIGSCVLTGIVSLLLLLKVVYPAWYSTVCFFPSKYEERNEDRRSPKVLQTSYFIADNTEPDDKISVYGNWDIIYLVSNRQHATKYSYQFPIGEISSDIMDDYWKEMEEDPPKMIVINLSYDDRMDSFIKKHNYKIVFDWTFGATDWDRVKVYQLS